MFFLFLLYAENVSASQADIETQIAVEKSMEERLRSILVRITGSEQLLVIINAQLHSGREEESSRREQIVLPGVPVRESMERSAAAMDTRTMIQNIRATIILDTRIPDEAIQVVEEVTLGILGIDERRGDQLHITKMDFQTNPFSWGSVFVPPHLWWLIGSASASVLVIFLLLFLFGPFKHSFSSIAEAVKAVAAKEDMSGFAPSAAAVFDSSASAATPTSSLGERILPEGKIIPFSYVSSIDSTKLSYILSKLESNEIAAVLSYQDAPEAARILELLDNNKRVFAAKSMGVIKEMEAATIENLDAKIRRMASYTAGGEAHLEEAMNLMSNSARARILEGIKISEPDLAARIESKMVVPMEIALLNDARLYEFYAAIGARSFAQFINLLDEASRDKALERLPQGLSGRLRQECDMLGKPEGEELNRIMRSAIPVLKKLRGK